MNAKYCQCSFEKNPQRPNFHMGGHIVSLGGQRHTRVANYYSIDISVNSVLISFSFFLSFSLSPSFRVSPSFYLLN